MSKISSLIIATVAVLAIPAAPAGASSPAPKAKLTMAQARAIALKVSPGRIQDAEYEKEGGGWRYSFDIRQGNRIHEIGVDANSGRIVENKFEGLRDKD